MIKIAALFLLGISISTVQAQQATTATGGNASGSGGNLSYSIGQVVYNSNSGSNGSVAQGLQQPYEISIVLGLEDYQIGLNMQVYPNPTTDYLTLNIGNSELSTLNFQLFDISGKLIESKRVENTTEIIRMGNLPSGTYFLNVINNNKELKIFKIIKN